MENNGSKYSGFYSKKLKAGKRRTYFFDVRNTKQGDYFVTITESKKKFEGDGYESHKIFLYKEDFKKFMEALNDTLNHVKTELMPDFDYDSERTYRSESHENGETNSLSADTTKTPSSETETPSQTTGTDFTTQSKISDDEEISWN